MSVATIRLLRAVLIAALLGTGSAWAQTEVICPPMERKFGPYDYTNASHRARYLDTVERRHFTSKVRNLHPRGETGTLIGDINYTLNWFPNHHGALDLLSRLAVRERSSKPLGTYADIACRFQWARQVSPRDPMVPMIEGLYFHRIGRSADARKLMEAAVEMSPGNATAHYNLGLVLVQMRDFEAARTHAQRAYELGFPLPGLRDQLSRAGYPLQN